MSKLFVTRRERFDGADIVHIIYGTAETWTGVAFFILPTSTGKCSCGLWFCFDTFIRHRLTMCLRCYGRTFSDDYLSWLWNLMDKALFEAA